jgi:hypothetical protein
MRNHLLRRAMHRLAYLCLCVVLSASAGCGSSFRFTDATLEPAPSSKAELCSIVGLDPDSDEVCHGGGLRPLLEAAFPPGIATRDQIQQSLGAYHVHTDRFDNGGSLEMYAVLPGLLGPAHALFLFDESGVLVDITIED